MKPIIVLYHNDFDGFGAAWAAWKKFKNTAEYIKTDYHFSPPKNLKNKEVYLLDFCYEDKATMEKLLRKNKRIIVVDHHISKKEVVKISSKYVFDPNHSGAVLAWKYFYPQKPVPKLLRHIEDMDLWKFKLSQTKKVIAALYTYDLKFSVWNKIVSDLEYPKTKKKYLREGEIIIKYENKLVEELAKNAEEVVFENHKSFAVNSPILSSQIGHFFVDNRKALGIVWRYDRGRLVFSLRSSGRVDVSRLAQKFSGGGHKAASGFNLKSNINFPWRKI